MAKKVKTHKEKAKKRPRKGQYSPSREYYGCYIVCSKLQNGTGRNQSATNREQR